MALGFTKFQPPEVSLPRVSALEPVPAQGLPTHSPHLHTLVVVLQVSNATCFLWGPSLTQEWNDTQKVLRLFY